jgi:EAL domain-containing protein (putative c-di-GMP-specific phosphodiesterase class I)/GGDEF domain-containing protein
MSGRVRIKWEFNDDAAKLKLESPAKLDSDELSITRDLEAIRKIITGNVLTTAFQPIFNMENGSVLGYEALTRLREENPFGEIQELFLRALKTGCIGALDSACLSTALKIAHAFSLGEKSELLFMNVCPETLMNNTLFLETCDSLVQTFGISRERIVLEVTEESMISNFVFFRQSLDMYRHQGYKIAIDDFGAGYGGLKMLSTIEPDFVKIDRHFISSIDRATIKFNLVDAIATACHRIGIAVVAEGIEREEELSVLQNTGIQYMQGFFLGCPSPEMNADTSRTSLFSLNTKDSPSRNGEPFCMGDLCSRKEPIAPEDQVITALRRFTDNRELRSLPVVDGSSVVGMLHRSRFLEENIIGKHGYGYSMNTYKTVADVMEKNFFLCEANTSIDDVSRRIQARKAALQYDDICVTRTGRYHGTVPISLLLNSIMERNIILAKGSNPLTGLPGNDFIQREISLRLNQSMHFDVAYIDIDNFKPFNDHYGFERGDYILKSLAAMITGVLSRLASSSFNFAGHIGGDDFIVVTRPQDSLQVAQEIITEFESHLPDFHGPEDFDTGRYSAKNRRGVEEEFSLLSLSIGMVSTEVYRIESYPQLASLATEVKKKAKMENGFSIVRDRRKLG